MALLLDDDEVCTATATTSIEPPQRLSGMPAPEALGMDSKGRAHESRSASATTTTSTAQSSMPSTAAAPRDRECSFVSASLTVMLPSKGGDGMKKMDALLFGKTRVALLSDDRAVGLKRSADAAFGKAIARKPEVLKASLVQGCDGSTHSTSTQPKIVSAARSFSFGSLQEEHPSATSLDTMLLTPQERSSQLVISTSPEHQTGSPSASPPARRPSASSSAREETAGEPVASPEVKESPKLQMKLSDFFAKMACKR
ncbi:hypothetical protein LSCM1_01810 [Leishmania martiniquensis]|uniref:Uncharacterized protein n=1 Tax=Leishmania martiniquensis TaxID=1580590 RepID=A0A836G9B5_9TRYP|nr:hypothetical protein LSCM1_01810 [Leishmania martiniquensis]